MEDNRKSVPRFIVKKKGKKEGAREKKAIANADVGIVVRIPLFRSI